MTVTAVQITSRPAPAATATRSTRNTAEPTGVIVVANIEALTSDNIGRCNDSNPYN